MGYLFVVIAIIFEVTGTLSLRMATSESTKKPLWIGSVVVSYAIAFFGLTMALSHGLALGVVYGVWAASGVALTSILSRILFKEPLTKVMALGIGLIIVGVLLIELGAAH